jgi:hypothetical protein
MTEEVLHGVSRVISKYMEEHFASLSSTYQWDFDNEKFPVDGYSALGSNSYEKSRHLREYLNGLICQQHPLQIESQKWYVQHWGRVRGNKDETLNSYIASTYDDLIKLGTKGVATWSKILCVRDPKKYAIYDARVSIALNSIQKKSEIFSPMLFPLLPTQNRKFVGQSAKLIIESGFFKLKSSNFYSDYLKILHQVAVNKPWDIQDVEMALFSGAENLSNVWLK